MNTRVLLSVLAVLTIAGCRISPEKQSEQRNELINAANAALASREPCCHGFEDAKIHGVWPSTLSLVRLGEKGDVGVFGADKVYFVGLELPSDLPTRNLLIKEWLVMKARDPHAPATILDSLPGPGSGYVLKPSVAFLDSEHKLISEVAAPICFDQGWDAERTGFFAGATAPANAKFAIIFGRPQGPEAGLHHKYSGGGGTVGFSFEYSGTLKAFFGPTGNLQLGLVNEAQVESLRTSRDQECADVLAAWNYRS